MPEATTTVELYAAFNLFRLGNVVVPHGSKLESFIVPQHRAGLSRNEGKFEFVEAPFKSVKKCAK